MDVQLAHLVLVHKGGALDDSPGKEHRFEVGDRGYSTGTAHLIVDGKDGGEGGGNAGFDWNVA